MSEKLYDALIAGAIPLYWGNVSDRLLRHVPELAGLFVDIRGMTSADLQRTIDAMTEQEIARFRDRIRAKGGDGLRKVGTAAFSHAFAQAHAIAAAT